MFQPSSGHPEDNPAMYALLRRQAVSLLEGEADLVANLANLSALLNLTLPEISWVGFYLLHGKDLVLGPFQGKPACVRIPMGKGVCGTAAETDRIQVIPDVRLFPNCCAAARAGPRCRSAGY